MIKHIRLQDSLEDDLLERLQRWFMSPDGGLKAAKDARQNSREVETVSLCKVYIVSPLEEHLELCFFFVFRNMNPKNHMVMSFSYNYIVSSLEGALKEHVRLRLIARIEMHGAFGAVFNHFYITPHLHTTATVHQN